MVFVFWQQAAAHHMNIIMAKIKKDGLTPIGSCWKEQKQDFKIKIRTYDISHACLTFQNHKKLSYHMSSDIEHTQIYFSFPPGTEGFAPEVVRWGFGSLWWIRCGVIFCCASLNEHRLVLMWATWLFEFWCGGHRIESLAVCLLMGASDIGSELIQHHM